MKADEKVVEGRSRLEAVETLLEDKRIGRDLRNEIRGYFRVSQSQNNIDQASLFRFLIFPQTQRFFLSLTLAAVGHGVILQQDVTQSEGGGCFAHSKVSPFIGCLTCMRTTWLSTFFRREYLDNVSLFHGCGEKLLDAISVLLREVQV